MGTDEQNPIQYTARENDDTGLYYYRARYYDPQLKRFISEDPIGINGGLNVYAYVNGNPISLIDPMGLAYSSYGEHGIKPGGAVDYDRQREMNCENDCLETFLGITTASGAAAVAAGAPVIPYPKGGADAGKSTGATSLASSAARRISGNARLPRAIRTPTISNIGAKSASVGGIAGRYTPIIDTGILAYEYYQLLKCISDCANGNCESDQ